MLAIDPGVVAALVSALASVLIAVIALAGAARTRKRTADVELVKNDQQFLRDIITTQREELDGWKAETIGLRREVRHLEEKIDHLEAQIRGGGP